MEERPIKHCISYPLASAAGRFPVFTDVDNIRSSLLDGLLFLSHNELTGFSGQTILI